MSPTSPESQQAAHLEKLHAQLQADIGALQEKEANLRAHEERLRQLLDQAADKSNGLTRTPFTPPQAVLDAEWEKFYRAHALREAERRAMIDERLLYKQQRDDLLRREEALKPREAWVAQREKELAAAASATPFPPPAPKPTFTGAPFLMAKNLFSRRSARAGGSSPF